MCWRFDLLPSTAGMTKVHVGRLTSLFSFLFSLCTRIQWVKSRTMVSIRLNSRHSHSFIIPFFLYLFIHSFIYYVAGTVCTIYTHQTTKKNPWEPKFNLCSSRQQFDYYFYLFITSLPHQICKMQPHKIVNVCNIIIPVSNDHYWLTAQLQFNLIQFKLSNAYT